MGYVGRISSKKQERFEQNEAKSRRTKAKGGPRETRRASTWKTTVGEARRGQANRDGPLTEETDRTSD